MSDMATIADRYISVWNEADPKRRLDLLATHWTEDATYVDPMAQGRGHEQISTLIGAVHDRFPGFRFALKGAADGHGDHGRFSWSLGPEGVDGPIKGTDFVQVQDGRLKSVTGFLDQVPAGA